MTSEENANTPSGPASPQGGYGFFDLLWLAIKDIPGILRSLKFAVWVLIILSLFTMAGTVLPQQHLSSDPIELAHQYQGIFKINPDDGHYTFGEFAYYKFVVPLELYDIFYSNLYFTLIVLLVVSSTLCAWDRIWVTRNLLRARQPSTRPETIRNMPNRVEGTLDMNIEGAGDKFRKHLQHHRFQVFEKSEDDGRTGFYIRKNSIHHIAAVVFHFALVLILIGFVLGDDRTYGYEGNIVLAEGSGKPLGAETHRAEVAAAMGQQYQPSTDVLIQLVDYESIYRANDYPGIDPDTGFPINYTGAPSDYLSHVKIIEQTESGEIQDILEDTIEVNFPLRFQGVAYYQSSVNYRISLSYGNPGSARTPVVTFLNEPFLIEPLGLECTISMSDIVGGTFVESDGTRQELPYTVRLVDYNLYRQGLSETPVLLGYVAEGWPITISGLEISLDGIEEFTILHYVHDPGVPYVYVGGFILMLGIMFSLYLPWRTGRIVLVPDGNRTKWLAGGNWSGFREFIEPLGDTGTQD